ncbi:transglycosylase SLT domain-containing protein [Roseobacter sp.]|uniref:lytic transglycosylase domain-containing protein n=1 Tax=Roseobacter sp. TaxID=1907202 RepID=UPI003299B1EA
MKFTAVLLTALMCLPVSPIAADTGTTTPLPPMRWSHMDNHTQWNARALEALRTHGQPLVSMVPRDISDWCPYYEQAGQAGREAFWVGFMSALSKHESTYKPWAVGGGGKWYGLLQILPATARGYGCQARSGAALKDGGANLSCAIRIMAVTVPRDGVVAGRDAKWRGVAADWGPMRVASKRSDIADWVSAQPYCAAPPAPEPVVRKKPRFISGSDR